ncbi:MAG: glycosyltransferase family 4 protein [Thermoanaerobaculia bacterium]
MTRIACLSHQSGVGSEMALVRLLSALDRRRIEPLVVLPEEGPLRGEIEALSIPVHVLPLAWWIPATHWSAGRFLEQLQGLEERAAALEGWLVRERVELVHTNTIVTLEGALAAARLGVPHVWHSRGLFGGGFPPAYLDDTRFFLSAVDLLAGAVVCVSEGVKRQMAEVCRLAPLRVVYDGFDLDRFLARPVADPGAVRARYGLPETARVVACVGGIQRRKGQLDLVEAAALLARDFPGLVFVLAGGAGDAEYLEVLLERIAALGLGDRFRLIGFEPEVRDLLSVSAALVHPSHSEGFGLAILEAVAVGLPVVATRCGGPEEIIEDGVSGLLVPPQDPPALAAALRRVLGVPTAARLLGASAATRAARAFSLEATARGMEEIYRELLAAPVEGRELRARIAGFVAGEALTRARLAAAAAAPPAEPPPAPHSPPAGSWLAGLRRRFGGSTP